MCARLSQHANSSPFSLTPSLLSFFSFLPASRVVVICLFCCVGHTNHWPERSFGTRQCTWRPGWNRGLPAWKYRPLLGVIRQRQRHWRWILSDWAQALSIAISMNLADLVAVCKESLDGDVVVGLLTFESLAWKRRVRAKGIGCICIKVDTKENGEEIEGYLYDTLSCQLLWVSRNLRTILIYPWRSKPLSLEGSAKQIQHRERIWSPLHITYL